MGRQQDGSADGREPSATGQDSGQAGGSGALPERLSPLYLVGAIVFVGALAVGIWALVADARKHTAERAQPASVVAAALPAQVQRQQPTEPQPPASQSGQPPEAQPPAACQPAQGQH